jgi:hypothetical protein
LQRPLVSLKFWSLVCLGAFVIGAGDLLSVGIGSCSNRAVTDVDQFLTVGSALVFVASAVGVLVSGFVKLASVITARSSEAASDSSELNKRR